MIAVVGNGFDTHRLGPLIAAQLLGGLFATR